MMILVTGCARSGTTLTANMIHASFANVTYLPDEMFPADDTHGITLGKLPSVAGRVSHLVREYPTLRVVFVLRDPRAVLISRHWKDPASYWSNADEWCAAAREWLATRGHPRVAHVRFEELLCAPDAVEAQLGCLLGVRACRRIAQSWQHFTDSDENLRALGGPRPLDRGRATPKRTADDDLYLSYLYEHSADLRDLTRQAGYG